MPRPKIDIRYQNRVAVLAEQGYKTPTITKLIKEEAERAGRVDYPSERSVRRIYDGHIGKDPELRKLYELFRWPDSMEDAGIPWEASPVVLDLLRNEGKSPTVGFVKWYWRVHLAAPDLPFRDKKAAAEQLDYRAMDSELVRVQMRAIETYLAYVPWRETDVKVRDQIWQELFVANEITERCQNYFRYTIQTEGDVWLLSFVEAAEDSFDDRKVGPGMWFPDLERSEIQESESDGR